MRPKFAPETPDQPGRPPRVALIENSLHTTGAFVSALAIATSLRDQYEFEFILPARSTLKSQIEAAGFACHQLPMAEIGRSVIRILKYLPVLLTNTVRLRRLLETRRINLIIVNDYYNMLGVTAKLTGWRGVLLTYVRLMPANQQPLLNRAWSRLALMTSNAVLAVSEAVRSQLPASSKVRVLYDPKDFFENHPAENPLHGDGLIRCLYLANYIAGKGHGVALQSFRNAYAKNPALRLRFVGGDMGLAKNKALRTSLGLKTHEMGLANVVTFDGYSSDIEMDIKHSDIVLNFSESESFSHTCLEASAYGRPIISTRSGGPAEIIENNLSGILVDVDDVSAMTDAILRISNDRTLRLSMGQTGRLIARERFSTYRFVLSWHQILETSNSSINTSQ